MNLSCPASISETNQDYSPRGPYSLLKQRALLPEQQGELAVVSCVEISFHRVVKTHHRKGGRGAKPVQPKRSTGNRRRCARRYGTGSRAFIRRNRDSHRSTSAPVGEPDQPDRSWRLRGLRSRRETQALLPG